MDAKTVATAGLDRACSIFLQDLRALPEEGFCKKFGEKTRTVADIVYEVNMVNDHAGMVMRGETPFPWPEGWITAPSDFCQKEQIIAAFEESSQRVRETVASFTSEQLEAPMTTPEGESTAFASARFLTIHLWYHSGQINFIQTMLGDTKWNWV